MRAICNRRWGKAVARRNERRRAIGAAWLLGALLATPAAFAGSHVIVVDQMRYTPSELTVQRGDEVVWINRDLFAHTASADGDGFDSGSIAPQASWHYVARERGRFPYACTFHPTMHGTLNVR
ncbi:copper-binding protein [Burkholderia sp. Bp9126]|nr:copper-binding protein [Burkholderia sp. Bp9126]